MKVCIFGALSSRIDEIFIKEVEKLGEMLAKRGHSLVFGAAETGLMGAAARGFKKGGGFIHGIIPEFFRDEKVETIYDGCDKITYTKDMSERKHKMEDDCDAFLIVPGGVGTLEEFFEVLTLKQLGRHNKAIVIFNIDNYFDEFEKFMQVAHDRKFLNFQYEKLFSYAPDCESVINYLETYKPLNTPWQKLKAGD